MNDSSDLQDIKLPEFMYSAIDNPVFEKNCPSSLYEANKMLEIAYKDRNGFYNGNRLYLDNLEFPYTIDAGRRAIWLVHALKKRYKFLDEKNN